MSISFETATDGLTGSINWSGTPIITVDDTGASFVVTDATTAGQAVNFGQLPAVIDNTGATTDLSLRVGDVAYSDFVAQTSMPLHIATGDNEIYEMMLAGSFTATTAGTEPQLLPNNVAPTGRITYRIMYFGNAACYGTSVAGASILYLGVGGAPIFSGDFKIFTDTNRQRMIGRSAGTTTAVSYGCSLIEHELSNSVAWTSLGTVQFNTAWTGRITVKRIV
jgi:hypothetical protein